MTLGRTRSNSFAGIAAGSAPAFIAAQLLVAELAIDTVRALDPSIAAVMAKVVVPHGHDA